MGMLKQVARSVVPRSARRTLFTMYERHRKPTVAEGWDLSTRYSRYSIDKDQHLGDQWSDPDLLAADVAAEDFVSHLDETVFTPFLGTGDVLLEIGSGGGRFTEILTRKCNRLLATDTSAAMVKLLKRRFRDSRSVEIVHLDGFGLNWLDDHSVDLAFSFDVFVHIQPWDFYQYLTELKRVLKPGGKAIIHHSNTLSDEGWKKFLADIPQCVNSHKYYGSFSVMTPELAKSLIENAGLVCVDSNPDVIPRDCISLITAPG